MQWVIFPDKVSETASLISVLALRKSFQSFYSLPKAVSMFVCVSPEKLETGNKLTGHFVCSCVCVIVCASQENLKAIQPTNKPSIQRTNKVTNQPANQPTNQ